MNTIMATIIKKDSLNFLSDLRDNNNREWFNAQKGRYLAARENIADFTEDLLVEMNKHDLLEPASGKQSLFRIYRDVRFSKEKTPYNTHWSASFKRAGKKLRGGYYLRIESGNSRAVCGFWGPDADDMKRIRQDIDANYPEWYALLHELAAMFGDLWGERLATAPRGYAKDHPAIDLLRYKQFMLKRSFTDDEVLSPNFVSLVNDAYKKMRPFLNHMTEVLTTDANGLDLER
jgi:uncharacterized protein (TIGR02453 family)